MFCNYFLPLNATLSPLFFEYLYVYESLADTGKLDNGSWLQIGQVYSVSDISDNSSRYFLVRQVTVHRHWSHNRNILSLTLGLFSFITFSVAGIALVESLSII